MIRGNEFVSMDENGVVFNIVSQIWFVEIRRNGK
jgi:hypothetical protein